LVASETSSSNSWPRWLGGAALLLICVAVYAPALPGDFVWDDDTHLLDNPVLEEDGLYKVWFTPPERINYWPATFTSYWIEYQLWGFDPFGYHVVNVLIHALNAILLWRVLNLLRLPYSWLVALLFAVHPVNVESVAWIAQRKSLLSMLFAMISLLFFLRHEAERRWELYVLAVVGFCLAMLSKASAAPLPAVLLLCAWWQRGAITRRDIMATIPFFAITAVLSLIEISAQDVVAGSTVVREEDLVTRLVTSGWVWWFYVSKAMVPMGICLVYPRWEIDSAEFITWLPLVLVGVTLAIPFWQRRGWGRHALFGLVYFGLMLSPVLGFFDIYYMRYSYVADHYQYMALPGMLALMVCGLGVLATQYFRVSAGVVTGIALTVALVFSISSSVLSASYRGAEGLWRDTIAKNPEAFLAQYNLAHLLQLEGRLDEAESHYREALRIEPDDAATHSNLGKLAQDRGQPLRAIRFYRLALDLDPANLDAHNNMAVMLVRQGKIEAALSHLRSALEIDPSSATVHYNIAELSERLERFEDALVHYQRVNELDPSIAPEKVSAGLARSRAALDPHR
jgi:tetratricopeptide (TPR) repeat protein